jgi:hypothetical protein
MELHETAWNFFHAAWNSMELHETAWKSWTSATEQENMLCAC